MIGKVYTAEEVADILGVKRVTIWDYIRTGKMECIKLSSRCYRITEDQLQSFIKKQK